MQDNMSVECTNCGFIFPSDGLNEPVDKRKPCPNCGSFRRNIRFTHTETLELREGLNLKANKPTSKHKKHRADYEFEEGEKLGRNGRLVHKKVIKDRERANSPHSYQELVKDVKTGEIIVNKDEKLSEHRQD
jgi:predicted  nucleic acid-binding Zn-ribbon protein